MIRHFARQCRLRRAQLPGLPRHFKLKPGQIGEEHHEAMALVDDPEAIKPPLDYHLVRRLCIYPRIPGSPAPPLLLISPSTLPRRFVLLIVAIIVMIITRYFIKKGVRY